MMLADIDDLIQAVIAVVVILGGAIGSAINAKKQKPQSSPLDEELNRPARDEEESAEGTPPRQRRPQYPTAQPLPQPGQRADAPQVRPTVRPASQPTFPPVVAPGPVLRPRPVRPAPQPARSAADVRKPTVPARDERGVPRGQQKPVRRPAEPIAEVASQRPPIAREATPVQQPAPVRVRNPASETPARTLAPSIESSSRLASTAGKVVAEPSRPRHVRTMLRSSSVSGLRDAIVMAELLGPPLALRESDPFSPCG